jgi:hypothetical protein
MARKSDRDQFQFGERPDIAARCPYQKSRRVRETVRLLGDIPGCADSVYNYVINHTQIACVYVVNVHASAGFDRGLDQFAPPVHDVTGPLENVLARIIRAVLANNEGFDRLIIGSRAFLSRRFDDRSRYGYWFFCSCFLSFMSRTRLGQCQRRSECAASEGDNCFLHYDAFLLNVSGCIRMPM